MSVTIVNNGSYHAARIIVGKTESPYHREYIPLKGLSEKQIEKIISQAQKREEKIKQEYLANGGIKKGKRNHQFEKMAKNQPSIIRGINIYFLKGAEVPSCKINLCIMSYGKVEAYSKQTQDYRIFKREYLKAVDRAVVLYGLERARKGWKQIPLTEDQFYERMDKAQRGA